MTTRDKKRLGQIINIGGAYSPTKASLFLRPHISSEKRAFELDYADPSKSYVSLDATNYSGITQSDRVFILNNSESNYTGIGYMELLPMATSTSGKTILSYPVRRINTEAVPYHIEIYLRYIATEANSNVSILWDGKVVDSDTLPISAIWAWHHFTVLDIIDTNEHTLGIRCEKEGIKIDKVYMGNVALPIGEGPAFTDPPYMTLHCRLMCVNNSYIPTSQLLIYDYKTTIEEVKWDDWYNFNLSVLDGTSVKFSGSYAIVLDVSGSDATNFISWDETDGNFSEPSISESL